MTEQQKDELANIRKHAAEARELQDELMDFDASSTETRLAQTLRELQSRVREQQAALDKLRDSSQADVYQAAYASQDPRERLRQLLSIKDAYTRLTPTAPFLPSKGSVVPALLAARILQHNVHGTKEAIAGTQDQIAKTESTLAREQANLHDANLITKALEDRIERLRAQHTDRSHKSPAQLAQDLIEAKRGQRQAYEERSKRLTVAFLEFTEYLAPMLAAEELGGPVVGEMPDVEEDNLAAGFTNKGKAKSTKKPVTESKRQRTIDQIWGDKAVVDDGHLTEAEAAENDMRELVEGLVATLLGPGGGKTYFELERESAASRFLVRAKVAQFHPRDAKKLRLIDFGKELAD